MTNHAPSPELVAALESYQKLRDQGLEWTAPGLAAWQKVIDLAPPALLEAMHAVAVGMGILPDKPDGYSTDDQPVYRLEDIARRLGLSEEEAKASIASFLEAEEESPLIDPASVQKLH
jgi:hypothetical protein